MLFLYSLILILVPTLLVCMLVLTIILNHWKKHPCFKVAMNFKDPCWVILFVSLGAMMIGYTCGKEFPNILRFFHVPAGNYNGMGILILFWFLALGGAVCCLMSSICCLWRLMRATLCYVRIKNNANKQKSKT